MNTSPMKAVQATEAMAVFSVESEETIRKQGGSVYWKVQPARAKEYKFVVIIQNRWRAISRRQEWGIATGDNKHSDAFLVGKLADVVPAPDQEGRYKLVFSAIARLTPPVPVTWGWRMPVNYTRSLEDMGIDPAKLVWEPLEQPTPSSAGLPDELHDAARRDETPSARGGPLVTVTRFAAEQFGVGIDEIDVQITLRRPPAAPA